jgi:hypothetical protein
MQQAIVNRKALSADIIPLGISLIAVRGFFASKCRSKYLLKAIAALRAVTMQMRTKRNLIPTLFHHTKFVVSHPHPMVGFKFHCPAITFNGFLTVAKKNPIIAKGKAKMVCENLTNDK